MSSADGSTSAPVPAPDPAPAPGPARGGHGWRRARQAALAVLLLAGAVWVAVPAIARRVAEDQAREALGRTLHVGAVHFNLLTLRLAVDDLALAGPAPGAPPSVQVRHAELGVSWRSLLHGAPVLHDVKIDAPVLRLARTGEGHFDVDDILARLARRPASPPAAEPARFAVYNLQLTQGRLEFDDRPVGRRHVLEQLELGVPAVSNFPADADIEVQPRLGFVLDGVRYDSQAAARPFRADRPGTVELHSGEVALAAFLPYWPASLDWRPRDGRLRVDATLSFAAPPHGLAQWSLAGRARLDDLVLVDRAGAPLVRWQHLAVDLRELRPLEHRVNLQRVALEGLELAAARDAQGRIDLVRTFAGAPQAAPSAPSAPASSASAASPSSSSSAWTIAVGQFELQHGRLGWRDAQVSPPAALALQDLQVRVDGARWPLPPGPAASAAGPDERFHAQVQARWVVPGAPGPGGVASAASATSVASAASAGSAASAASAASAGPPGRIALDARIGARGSQVQAEVDRLDLAPLRPYIASAWSPPTSATLSLQARALWDGALDAAPRVEADRVALDEGRVNRGAAGRGGLAWRHAEIQGLALDLPARHAQAARLALDQPDLWLQRDARGRLDVAAWLPASGGAARAPAPAAPASGPGWQAELAHLEVTGGRLHWRDAPPAGPVAADLDGLSLSLEEARWPAPAGATSPIRLSTRVAAAGARGSAGAGLVAFEGRLGLQPVAWQGRLRVERLPLHLGDAYVAAVSPLAVLHADAGWHGTLEGALAPAGLRLHARGDAVLTDVHTCARAAPAVSTAAAGEPCDLLAWQSLGARGLDLAVTPARPPVLAISQLTLAKGFARLVVTEEGRFNLTDLAPPAPGASAPAAATSAPAPASAPASAPTPAPAADLPDIRIDGIAWTDGRVQYTDRFVRPNYSADLAGLTGRLGGFSSRAPGEADLELTGRVEGTGLLDVRGRLNPLARPLALDVQARATDIELAPLSPYAGKYAGYNIERGKLSMNVHYLVRPDGQLTATNQVILNQLTFGEKVDSPTATRLPVLLAVALLKDRHGVIDINLPIGGSINDPQFSVGGIIWKLILNLIGKALTAPFALLAGGGESDLSQVLFVPGTAQMKEGSDRTLDKVAESLKDRPSLQLTITGLADEAYEHADIAAANLEARLAGMRRTELLQADQHDVPDRPELSPEDRSRLVRRLYAETKLSDKPRNVLGLAKDIPQAEMEARLKAGLPLPPDGARHLAVERARVVREALGARGLDNERMFVAAPREQAAGSAEPGIWQPHAQLDLATR